MPKIHIKGLVKAARFEREALAAGIPPHEANAFRKRVRSTVAQVETLCREHHMTPQDLPAPSYRAYRFLKELPLDALPLPQGLTPEPPQTVRITNVIAAQNDMNATFAEWLLDPQQQTEKLTAQHPKVQQFARLLAAHVSEIEVLARNQGGAPGHLPTRSLRAYQWLKFLSEPSTLVTHLETLRSVLREFHQPRCTTRLTPQPPAEIEFAYSSHLYRAVRSAAGLRVTLHEGLLGAPPEVLRAVVCVVLRRGREDYQKIVRDYAAGEDFLEIVAALELTTAAVEDFTRGCTYDLEQVFDRVNAAYFGGKISRPKLLWNRIITRSRMGHYDLLRDAVMVSITLDAPSVPDYVIDFVMYHELLHKQLGVNVVNGRRNAHTPEFRAAERRFRRYVEARAFLNAAARP